MLRAEPKVMCHYPRPQGEPGAPRRRPEASRELLCESLRLCKLLVVGRLTRKLDFPQRSRGRLVDAAAESDQCRGDGKSHVKGIF